ncbi:MAG: hypothetical protein MJZ96_00465 [Paludibacteraceae bacterium]|nr:hypothetical protein [Paludibacteraceae bacterium]
MKQNRIRLTESQLHRVIKESVNKVLKEGEYSMGGHQKDSDYLRLAYQTIDDTPEILAVTHANRDELAQSLAQAFANISAEYGTEPFDD